MPEKRSKEINREETSWLRCVKTARDYILDMRPRLGRCGVWWIDVAAAVAMVAAVAAAAEGEAPS
ncbi:hypothetical protein E2C01_027782 [Portunus trituberculatus]|uniref:Uncharacterized protein n=1 Tax=Portunus trituberculatus TaxID=210409 RepID=A0A5B7ELT6_PORTR|nr:hypothetical protein [Portunus trituberculatus]